MANMCFSFQASGHKFLPLDDLFDGPVVRLYCPRCGRVIPANQLYNQEMWSNVDLPLEIEQEVGGAREPIH